MRHPSCLRPALLAAVALCLGAAPLSAQTTGILDYVEHIDVVDAHTAVLSANIALSYRDRYGDLQGPPSGSRDERSVLYLFDTKGIHLYGYTNSGSTTAAPHNVLFGNGDILLTPNSEVSYPLVEIGYRPPTSGPSTIFNQTGMMTGSRNALYLYDLKSSSRVGLTTLVTEPPLDPYSPGSALLQTGPNTAILTTREGTISTIDTSGIYSTVPDNSGVIHTPVTPLISAQGSAPGELSNPTALAIGPDGLLYELDAGNNRIQKFNATTGEYQGGFSLPAGMSVFTTAVTLDGGGNLVYHGTGTDVLSTSMAISSEGHIYLGDGLGGGFVFNLNGDLLANFHPPEPDGTWVNGTLTGALGVGSYLQYDGMGNVFTYVEGKGLFRYRDPTYDDLDYVNRTVNGIAMVTSGPGDSVFGNLTFQNDLSFNFAKLLITDPVTVRTGNIYVNRDEWGIASSTGIIEGGTLVTAGEMHKINDGTLILNNVNTYAGKTVVDDGTLIVNGSIAGDARVTSGTTLGGHGVIGGSVVVEDAGTLSPGNSPGLLTIEGDLTLSDSTLLMEFAGTGVGMFDQLAVLGAFTANGTLSLQILDGYTPANGDTFHIFTHGGYDTGAFTVIVTNLGPGLSWDTSQLATTGSITVVPEPAEWGIALGLALGGLAFLRRHNRLRPNSSMSSETVFVRPN